MYILASDSKDKKFDVNGTIKKILEDTNNLLLKNTDKKFRLDLRENGDFDKFSKGQIKQKKKLTD